MTLIARMNAERNAAAVDEPGARLYTFSQGFS
jgi:hypothetical protein